MESDYVVDLVREIITTATGAQTDTRRRLSKGKSSESVYIGLGNIITNAETIQDYLLGNIKIEGGEHG